MVASVGAICAGEQQHTPERDDAAGRWDQGQVAGGERPEDDREAGCCAGAAAETGGEQPARERSGAPDGEQRGGYRPDTPGRPPVLLLGYAQMPEPAIRAGVRELAKAVRAARTRA